MKKSVTVQRLESRVLLSAGELDTSFGSQGTTSINVNGQWNAIAALPGGGFVVAGNTLDNSKRSGGNNRDAAIIVARYTADGTIGPSFGGAGVATFDFGSGADEAEHVMVRSDGRIIVAGKCNGIESTIRLTVSGALDSTFAKGGILKGFEASAMQPDGDLLGTDGLTIQRRSPRAGLVDTAFGDNGSVNFLTSVAGMHIATPAIFLLQPDGKIILAATFGNASGQQSKFIVTRLLASGQTDTSFATNGEYSDGSSPDRISTAITPDGNILISASYYEGEGTTELFALSPAGKAVDSFVPAFDPYIPLMDLTVNADGKIDLLYLDSSEGEVTQLSPDGSPDIRFDGGNPYSFDDSDFVVATQNQTGLLVAGRLSVNRLITESNDGPIERFPHGAHVVIFGTPSADHISVTHTATSFTFSMDGVSQTYLRDHVNNIQIYADAGNDKISIDGEGTDIGVVAGAGNDTVTILSGDAAYVDGGDGNDSISGAGIDPKFTGGLYAYGDAGNDHIIGSRFDDNIEGDSGNDTLAGDGNTNDGLFGGSGNDLLLQTGYATRGETGNDTLMGIGGDGGSGDDTYFIRDGHHQTIIDDDGQNYAQIDNSTKVKDTVAGNFKLIP